MLQSQIPSDLEVRFSKSKALPYFYSPSTGVSVWEAPQGLTPDQIAELPGADKYLGAASKSVLARPQRSSSQIKNPEPYCLLHTYQNSYLKTKA